jgi:hypothetical protein
MADEGANDKADADDETDGEVRNTTYADFLSQQVDVEEARKGSLEARGVTTITTSGALATVLLGIVTLTKGSSGTIVLPEASRLWVELALAAFALATIFSIAMNFPVALYWTDAHAWSTELEEIWQDDEATSQKAVADHHLEQLKLLNKWNDLKGYALMVAMGCQGIAIVLVAVAVWRAL